MPEHVTHRFLAEFTQRSDGGHGAPVELDGRADVVGAAAEHHRPTLSELHVVLLRRQKTERGSKALWHERRVATTMVGCQSCLRQETTRHMRLLTYGSIVRVVQVVGDSWVFCRHRVDLWKQKPTSQWLYDHVCQSGELCTCRVHSFTAM